jgi:hypothetical protein
MAAGKAVLIEKQLQVVSLEQLGGLAGVDQAVSNQCVSTFGNVGFSIVTWSCW